MRAERKFYQKSPAERRAVLAESFNLTETELGILSGDNGLSLETANHMVENVIGVFGLPLGIARNFIVNGKTIPVPMVTEESSVIAAASNGARMIAQNGGFSAEADAPLMIGQIQVVKVPDPEAAKAKIKSAKKELLAKVARINPTIKRLGGGPKGLKVHLLRDTSVGPMLIVHLIMDVRDAMGANAINTALEQISPDIEQLTGGQVRLRILSNLADKRLVRAQCTIRPDSLVTDDYSGNEVIARILEAAAFAEADPYRTVTHNKGVMNGIDAVAIATGNDWRAIEAGAYGWANRKKKMKPLTRWSKDYAGNLCGEIELPMAVGTVGGATRVHPAPAVLLKMMGIRTAAELAEVIACVGLAQNFAALRALVTEGIQKGHMALHARQVAIAAGAVDEQIEKVTDALCAEGIVRLDRAKEILETL